MTGKFQSKSGCSVAMKPFHFPVIVLFCTITVGPRLVYGECDAKKCIAPIKELMMDPTQIYGKTEDEMEGPCKKYKQSAECFNAFAGNCTDEQQSRVAIAMQAGEIGGILGPGCHNVKEFLKHTECFRTVFGKDEECKLEHINYFYYTTKYVYNMISDDLPDYCCNYKNLEGCTEKILNACDQDSKDFFIENNFYKKEEHYMKRCADVSVDGCDSALGYHGRIGREDEGDAPEGGATKKPSKSSSDTLFRETSTSVVILGVTLLFALNGV